MYIIKTNCRNVFGLNSISKNFKSRIITVYDLKIFQDEISKNYSYFGSW